MNKQTQTYTALGGVVALILSGCATTHIDPPLVAARDEVAKAQASADVARFAQADIDRARGYLAAAELADKHDDMKLAAHEAYLATQTARLALATADEHRAQEQVAAAGGKRQKIQLDARAREVDVARDRAADAEGRVAQAEENAQSATAEARSATAEASDLRGELAELHATQTARGQMVQFGDMLFDTAGDRLKPGADQTLDQLARFLAAHPERRVLAEGYTDSVGTAEFNQALSERRAQALKAALVARGVDGGRIAVAGFGREYAVASNADAGGRQLNRRVEVVISDSSGQIAAR